uniref:Uncharacterized protein n=1 Tax=Treubia lacunosa TaxID=93845 RepID=G4Y9Q7_9MARC|nr:hypothetical protein TrlaMp08 [Treubia lacunosa]AEH99703.1 hypothetical protein TrlaMp08 [Treubia lacunosa]
MKKIETSFARIPRIAIRSCDCCEDNSISFSLCLKYAPIFYQATSPAKTADAEPAIDFQFSLAVRSASLATPLIRSQGALVNYLALSPRCIFRFDECRWSQSLIQRYSEVAVAMIVRKTRKRNHKYLIADRPLH